jgi:hypothetical protein
MAEAPSAEASRAGAHARKPQILSTVVLTSQERPPEGEGRVCLRTGRGPRSVPIGCPLGRNVTSCNRIPKSTPTRRAQAHQQTYGVEGGRQREVPGVSPRARAGAENRTNRNQK